MTKEKLLQRYSAFLKRNNLTKNDHSYSNWLEKEVLRERYERKKSRLVILAPLVEAFFTEETQLKIEKYKMCDNEIVGMLIAEHRRANRTIARLIKKVRVLTKALQIDYLQAVPVDMVTRHDFVEE